jgi:hypothetical protein
MDKTANDIKARFLDELRYIRDFTAMTDELVRPTRRSLLQMQTLFNSSGVRGFTRVKLDLTSLRLRQPEMLELLPAMEAVEPNIEAVLAKQRPVLDKLEAEITEAESEIPPQFQQDLGDWGDYLAEKLLGRTSEKDKQALVDECYQKWFENAAEDSGDSEFSEEEVESYRRKFLRYMISSVEYERLSSKNLALERARQTFGKWRLAIRAQMPDSEINILRQSFLLLMTAFDAAVFDIMRAAMRDHFFQLIAVIPARKAIKSDEWGQFDDFPQFRDKHIEQHLKGHYLKDLLKILRDKRVPYCSTEDNDELRLTEIINRRNVHVHNRGRVDDRYLEVPDVVLDDLEEDDLAPIEDWYLEEAERITKTCVEKLTAWVNAGASI